MNSLIRELVIDGNAAEPENTFRGIAVMAGNDTLRIFMDYKLKFPDSYHEIIKLLFKPSYGAGITRIIMNKTMDPTFFSDAKAVCRNISVDYLKNDISAAENKCCCCLESSLTVAKNILKGFTQPKTDSNASGFFLKQLISAEQPWSGFFKTVSGLWTAAHITRFVKKDWKHIRCNITENCAAFTAENGDYTLIFANTDNTAAHYNVCVRNIKNADAILYCVETYESETGSKKDSDWFRVVDKIIPAGSKTERFYHIDVKPHSILTCTSLSVEAVDGTKTIKRTVTKPKSLELPYADCFNYGDELIKKGYRTPLYTTGQIGAFEIRSIENESVLEQAAQMDSLTKLSESVLVIGDKNWTNYSVSAEVRFADNNSENYAGVGLRCSYDGGYWFRMFADGKWQLRCGEIVAEGNCESATLSEWNTLKIAVKYDIIRCCANELNICEYTLSQPFIPRGCAALESARFCNKFRNLSVRPISETAYSCVSEERFSDNIRYTEKNNAGFDFIFTGEFVALMGEAENLRLKIEIDGKIITAGFYVKKCTANQTFWYKTGLSTGQHKVKVRVLSGKLELSEIITDEFVHSDGRMKQQKKALSTSPVKIKKSTILFGAGLAAAGTGAFIVNKLFKKKKNK